MRAALDVWEKQDGPLTEAELDEAELDEAELDEAELDEAARVLLVDPDARRVG
jgi:hypothetical protein